MYRVGRFLVAALLVAGCSEPGGAPDAGTDMPDAGLGPLIDQEAWMPVSASDDPFDDRPVTVECERDLGWAIEPLDVEPTVGIDTDDCSYLGLTQPLLRAVSPAETLEVKMWHFQLEGAGPTHAAIAVDGVPVWETTIAFPAPAALVSETFEVPGGASPGAAIVFHLHNHGLNSYNLISINAAQ